MCGTAAEYCGRVKSISWSFGILKNWTSLISIIFLIKSPLSIFSKMSPGGSYYYLSRNLTFHLRTPNFFYWDISREIHDILIWICVSYVGAVLYEMCCSWQYLTILLSSSSFAMMQDLCLLLYYHQPWDVLLVFLCSLVHFNISPSIQLVFLLSHILQFQYYLKNFLKTILFSRIFNLFIDAIFIIILHVFLIFYKLEIHLPIKYDYCYEYNLCWYLCLKLCTVHMELQ